MNLNEEIICEVCKEYVDIDTGEFIEGVLVSKDDVEKIRQAQERKAKRDKYLKEKNEFDSYIQANFGSFYFNNYMELWNKLTNENSALAFRFLYLCTYADFDGYLKFGSRKNGIDTNYMATKDFKEVFSISTGMTTKLKNELFENNLVIMTDNNRLKVNSTYYTRGKLSENDKKKSIRSFDFGIRHIYQMSQPKEHKKLGLIIPLLKYVNVHLNIVFKNVNEKEPKYMYPLDMKEICEIIGYDYTHSTKLKKCLSSTTVNGQPLLANVTHQGANFFVVNPAIFYKGKKLEDLKSLIDLFNVKSNK